MTITREPDVAVPLDDTDAWAAIRRVHGKQPIDSRHLTATQQLPPLDTWPDELARARHRRRRAVWSSVAFAGGVTVGVWVAPHLPVVLL